MEGAEQDVRLARVASIRPVAIDILRFELEPADRRPFAAFGAGAHIDVTTPGGPVRQYSLCGDPAQPRRYAIAVKLEREGRGGSASMHRAIEEGEALAFTGPRNLFPLSGEGACLLVAGGIGITPLFAMAQALAASGRPWELHYCARSVEHAAFLAEAQALPGGQVVTYFSEKPLLDARSLLADVRPGTDVYCCGPAPLMQAVKEASAHWPGGRVHFEYFAAPAVQWPPNTAFEVELARQGGRVVAVPRDRTLLQALRAEGTDVPSACEEGVCGTCEVRVLSGEPEHRDMLLSDAEKSAGRTMMVCVSRSCSPRLVLDL